MKSITFIDGANIYAASKMMQREFDFRKFAPATACLLPKKQPIRQIYYTTVRPGFEHDPVRPLLDYLSYNGFMVIEKEMREYEDNQGQVRYKGNIIADIAVGMMEMASVIDHITLFSGDGDLLSAVKAVQNKGVQVTVVALLDMVADEMRRQADEYVEFGKLNVFKNELPIVAEKVKL